MNCPKCNTASGGDWSQCQGACPLPSSPHYTTLADHDWTESDLVHAYAQGWGVFNDNPPDIQRLDEEGILSCDEEAKVYVLEHAATDEVCRKAIKLCYGF